jgi:hypothetical protein
VQLMKEHRTLWCLVADWKDHSYGHAVLVYEGHVYDPWRGIDQPWPWSRHIWKAMPVEGPPRGCRRRSDVGQVLPARGARAAAHAALAAQVHELEPVPGHAGLSSAITTRGARRSATSTRTTNSTTATGRSTTRPRSRRRRIRAGRRAAAAVTRSRTRTIASSSARRSIAAPTRARCSCSPTRRSARSGTPGGSRIASPWTGPGRPVAHVPLPGRARLDDRRPREQLHAAGRQRAQVLGAARHAARAHRRQERPDVLGRRRLDR